MKKGKIQLLTFTGMIIMIPMLFMVGNEICSTIYGSYTVGWAQNGTGGDLLLVGSNTNDDGTVLPEVQTTFGLNKLYLKHPNSLISLTLLALVITIFTICGPIQSMYNNAARKYRKKGVENGLQIGAGEQIAKLIEEMFPEIASWFFLADQFVKAEGNKCTFKAYRTPHEKIYTVSIRHHMIPAKIFSKTLTLERLYGCSVVIGAKSRVTQIKWSSPFDCRNHFDAPNLKIIEPLKGMYKTLQRWQIIMATNTEPTKLETDTFLEFVDRIVFQVELGEKDIYTPVLLALDGNIPHFEAEETTATSYASPLEETIIS